MYIFSYGVLLINKCIIDLQKFIRYMSLHMELDMGLNKILVIVYIYGLE